MKRILIGLLISSSFLSAKTADKTDKPAVAKDDSSTESAITTIQKAELQATLLKLNQFEAQQTLKQAKQTKFSKNNFVVNLKPGETYAFTYNGNQSTGYVTRVFVDGQYLSASTGQQAVNLNNIVGSTVPNVAILTAKASTDDIVTPYYLITYRPWETSTPDMKLIGFIHIPGTQQKDIS